MLAIPAGVGLSVLAGPILLLLYPAQRESALAATYHLQLLGAASIFVCIMLLTNIKYTTTAIPTASMVHRLSFM